MTPAERIASLEAEVARLRAEAAPAHPSPPLHVVLDRPGDYPEHPVARLALERDDLRRRLMEAAPRWQDGPPPEDGFYLREDPENGVVAVEYGRRFGFWHCGNEVNEPWGTARWAPIVRPT